MGTSGGHINSFRPLGCTLVHRVNHLLNGTMETPKELRQLPKGPNFFPNWDLHAGRILLNIFFKFYLLTLSKLHHRASWLSLPWKKEKENDAVASKGR